MTRTGALVWKEWRDHRIALAVFAAIVPLVSWPVQRWVFKFQEPEWTWMWVVPLCAGLATAIVASDLFAMDLSTARMASFTALPVPVHRHFTARTAFLAAVALAFAGWTVATNAVLVGVWGKPGTAAALFRDFDPAFQGLAMSAAVLAGVLVFSSLGVGGFRAVIGGVLLAGIGYVATLFAVEFLAPLPRYMSAGKLRDPITWLVAAAVLGVAAYAAFVGGRAHATGRKRGTLLALAIVVGAFGFPSGAAAWDAYRRWRIDPADPEITLQQYGGELSPDGRYIAVWATKPNGGNRSFVIRIEDGAFFDWPRRNEAVAGWTTEGLAWTGRTDSRVGDEMTARIVRPETGETVENVDATSLSRRAASGWGAGPSWGRWLRLSQDLARPASKGVAPMYRYRLWVKDDVAERTIEARGGLTPTPRVGEVLIVTPDDKLALVRLAGGEPEIVADDATGLGWWMAGSPDGRWFLVQTSKGVVVLDSTDWKRVAGPWADAWVYWCPGEAGPATVSVTDQKTESLSRLVEIATAREIVPDASLGVLGGHGSVQRLPDGGFVARAGTNRVLHLDADGKFIRRLFPPEE